MLCDAEFAYKLLFEKTFAEIGQVYYKAYYNAQLSHEKQMRLTVEKLEGELQFPPGSGRCNDPNHEFEVMHVVRLMDARQMAEVDRMEAGRERQQQEVETCDETEVH